MNQKVVKNIVICLSLFCFLSLGYVDRTTLALTHTASTQLELLSQLTQVNANSSRMLFKLSALRYLAFSSNNEQVEFISEHRLLIEQTRSLFDSLHLLDTNIELEILKLRKDFEKINVEWLNATSEQISAPNPYGANLDPDIQSLYLSFNKGLVSLSNIAISDIRKSVNNIKQAVIDMERLMVVIQLLAAAMMLGLFSFPIREFLSKKPFK